MVNLIPSGGSAPLASTSTTGGQNASFGSIFSDPDRRQKFFDALGAMGAGLTTGNNWSQQLANANLGAKSAIEQQKQTAQAAQSKNQTVQMLQAQSPELALNYIQLMKWKT